MKKKKAELLQSVFTDITVPLQTDDAIYWYNFSHTLVFFLSLCTLHTGVVEYVLQRCQESSLIRRVPGVATVRMTKWFIVLSGPLKHHTLCVVLWLQHSTWDYIPQATNLSLSIMFVEKFSLKRNINSWTLGSFCSVGTMATFFFPQNICHFVLYRTSMILTVYFDALTVQSFWWDNRGIRLWNRCGGGVTE